MYLYYLIPGIILVTIAVYLQDRPKFGQLPKGERLRTIRKSKHFKNGAFRNLVEKPQFTADSGRLSVFTDLWFRKRKDIKPAEPIPSIKTDLPSLPENKNTLVWFGHSSYFMNLKGTTILVDPVLSGSAAPFSFMMKAYPGSDIYAPADLPEIDYLLITHDHWDHTDYETLMALKPKIGTVICGLGTGAHFEYWGFRKSGIIERDWGAEIRLNDNITIATAPAQHFSGRTFKRNASLWTSFVVQTPKLKLYLGGDSGYGPHFRQIGQEYGPFDLAILENGQYNTNWKHVHMHPEEVLKAADDLQAAGLFPVHSAKFTLSTHAWDEPLRKITALAAGHPLRIITPLIGQPVFLDNKTQKFDPWWLQTAAGAPKRF